ncbi:DUF4227 family protein [Paenibacillaceae bacterium]|nr:DUF4227 family protein [Paenibacillaceae bacterium]
MIISLRKLAKRTLFLVLFVLLTIVACGGYSRLVGWIGFHDRYDEPEGRALKVFQTEQPPTEGTKMVERLRWFYLYGE